jgi:hypothetical protein
MNSTYAKIAPGSSTVSFPITVPMWTDLASTTQSKHRGRPLALTFVAPGGAKVKYGANCHVALDPSSFSFSLATSVARNNTAKRLAERIKVGYDAAVNFFPLQRAIPRLYYVGEDIAPEDPHYEIELPPLSMFFTSDPHLLVGLGFTGQDLAGGGTSAAVFKFQHAIGGTDNAREEDVDVYGFIHMERFRRLVLRGDTMLPGMSLNQQFDDNTTIAKSMLVQTEFADMDSTYVALTGVDRGIRGTTKEELIVGLADLLDKVRTVCNLRSVQVDVSAGQGRQVVLTSRAFIGCKTTLYVTLDDGLADAVNQARKLPLVFNLELPRIYVLEVRGGKVDPFKNRVPVKIQVLGQGHAMSWVEGGAGYTSILGTILDDKKPIVALEQGLIFTSEKSVMSVNFLDVERNIVEFNEEVTAHLEMVFTRIL